VLLTEEALVADDATYLRGLHEDDAVRYHVLVPADTERSLLVSVLDGLALGELRDTVDEVREGSTSSETTARVEATDALDTSLGVLRDAGATADGAVTTDDPVPALEEAVARVGADEVQVVTRPHVVEESFHRDWASRARRHLGVPVLHVYAGTHGWIA
jgi:hypothetical protein